MKLSKIVAVATLVAVTIGFSTQAYGGYKKPSNYGSLKKVSINAGSSANSIISAIDTHSNGVIITLKKGTHTFSKSITLKKNVHIRFQSGVTIKMTAEGNAFTLTGGDNSIVGPATITTTKSGLGQQFRAVGASCDNFLISKLTIKDQYTKFCTINCTKPAKNGTITNIKATGTTPGYGLCQVHAGEKMVWKNLDCTGGYSLRLEQSTGDKPWVGKISGKAVNIICRNGRGAVSINPTVANGNLTITKVRSYGCGWAVKAGTKATGNYTSVTIKDIVAKYGTNGQYKRSKFYVPDNLQSQVKNLPNSQGGDNGKFEYGPALGAFRRDGGGNGYNVSTISRSGFPSVYQDDPLTVTDMKAISKKR